MDDDFSERFSLLCRARGLRNVDVARLLRKDQSSTSLWWKGKGGHPRDRAATVATLFDGMTLTEFYSLDIEALRADAAAVDGGEAA